MAKIVGYQDIAMPRTLYSDFQNSRDFFPSDIALTIIMWILMHA